jgi:hypothetical protein
MSMTDMEDDEIPIAGDTFRVLEQCAETDWIINEGKRLGYIDKVWRDENGDLNYRITEAGAREMTIAQNEWDQGGGDRPH